MNRKRETIALVVLGLFLAGGLAGMVVTTAQPDMRVAPDASLQRSEASRIGSSLNRTDWVTADPIHAIGAGSVRTGVLQSGFVDRLGIDRTWELDFADPSEGGVEPLVWVAGLEAESLSTSFVVGDFVSREGVPYARISMELVEALEQVQAYLGARLSVHSAYRYPALNYDPSIEGAEESFHMAGRAADVSSTVWTPLEIAAAALDTLGCRIGVGLGRGFVHLDVRGSLARWTTDDAEMDEAAFDIWIRERCGLPAAPAESLQVAEEPAASPVELHGEAMRALAAVYLRRGERGAVVLDVREPHDGEPAYRLGFVPEGSADARAMGLDELLARCAWDRYFVFAVLERDGRITSGLMGIARERPPGIRAATDSGQSPTTPIRHQ